MFAPRLLRAAFAALILPGAVAATSTACGPAAPVKQPAPAAEAPAPAAAPPAPPVALDRDYPKLAEQAVQLHRAIADALRAAGEDCADAARRLDGLRATYAEVVAANDRILQDGRERELRPALARHSDQLDAAARAIVQAPAMGRCAQDAAFTRAFDELVGAPPPAPATSPSPPPAPAAPDPAPPAPAPTAPGTAGPAGRASSR